MTNLELTRCSWADNLQLSRKTEHANWNGIGNLCGTFHTLACSTQTLWLMYTGTTAAYVRRSDVHTTNVSTSDHAHPTSLVDDETDADTKGSSGVTETVYLESMPDFHKLLLLQVVWLRPSWIVQLSSANCLTNILKHSCIQVIASALTYLSTMSPGCHAGVARCSQADTPNWTTATQLTYHTEQEHPERTHSAFVVWQV